MDVLLRMMLVLERDGQTLLYLSFAHAILHSAVRIVQEVESTLGFFSGAQSLNRSLASV